MSNKVEIKKIVINIGDTIINLSLDQARELQDILNKTFGKKQIVYPYDPPYPMYPYYPTYTYWNMTYSGDTAICSSISGAAGGVYGSGN